MHQQLILVPLIPAPPMCFAEVAAAEMGAALSFAEMEKSAGTRRAYRSDFAIFSAWCTARGLQSMPAEPGSVARFLSAQATGGLKASTIGRRAAAIAYAHKLASFEPPTSVESVKAVVRGIRRVIGTAPDRKTAATADIMREMLAHCPTTLSGMRDRALLALGFAAALRRSELVALTVGDLTETPDGYRVLVRRSKNDQEGHGATIAVLRGVTIRPVAAVQAWLAAAKITEGPILRPVLKGQRVMAEPLSGHSCAQIVKKYVRLAGRDPAAFGAHSLRAGFATSAAGAGATVWKMQAITRHKSLDVLASYVRDADAFEDHAGRAFL